MHFNQIAYKKITRKENQEKRSQETKIVSAMKAKAKRAELRKLFVDFGFERTKYFITNKLDFGSFSALKVVKTFTEEKFNECHKKVCLSDKS